MSRSCTFSQDHAVGCADSRSDDSECPCSATPRDLLQDSKTVSDISMFNRYFGRLNPPEQYVLRLVETTNQFVFFTVSSLTTNGRPTGEDGRGRGSKGPHSPSRPPLAEPAPLRRAVDARLVLAPGTEERPADRDIQGLYVTIQLSTLKHIVSGVG